MFLGPTTSVEDELIKFYLECAEQGTCNVLYTFFVLVGRIKHFWSVRS